MAHSFNDFIQRKEGRTKSFELDMNWVIVCIGKMLATNDTADVWYDFNHCSAWFWVDHRPLRWAHGEVPQPFCCAFLIFKWMKILCLHKSYPSVAISLTGAGVCWLTGCACLAADIKLRNTHAEYRMHTVMGKNSLTKMLCHCTTAICYDIILLNSR